MCDTILNNGCAFYHYLASNLLLVTFKRNVIINDINLLYNVTCIQIYIIMYY